MGSIQALMSLYFIFLNRYYCLFPKLLINMKYLGLILSEIKWKTTPLYYSIYNGGKNIIITLLFKKREKKIGKIGK